MSSPRSAPPELPEFEFVRGVGGGGFADVFLYQQRRPSRQVAIKVLRAEHLSAESLRQFETEADLMARVSDHTYIVTIYSAHIAPDGRPYIVMEYYSEPHFGLRARGGELPVAEVLRVGVQVCSAVETAHQAGILHRDIKPANILTNAYGRPGLTDFGIAGIYTGADVAGARGVSLAYASPEVLTDDNLTGSVVADVYSLGATLFTLLAGRSPLWLPGGDNTDAALTARAVAGSIQPMGRDGVPATLEHLLTQALSTDPTQRPQSALALARALQDVEQALHLPPTPLEVARPDRGPVQPPSPLRRGDGDEDGTRRGGARIVEAQPDAAPPTAGRPEPTPAHHPPGQGSTPVGPSSTHGGPLSSSSSPPQRPALHDPDTVMRAPAPTGHAVTIDEQGPPDPWWKQAPAILVGAAVVLVLVITVGVVALGGDEGGETTAASEDATRPPVTAVALTPPPPDGVDLNRTDAGLSVTITAPDETGPLSYQVVRTDTDRSGVVRRWPGGDPFVVIPTTDITIEGVADDHQVCVAVYSVTDRSVASQTAATACLDAEED